MTFLKIYKGDYLTLLHTKHKGSAPFGIRDEDFFLIFICNSMGDVANLDPRGIIGRIYVGYHLALIY